MESWSMKNIKRNLLKSLILIVLFASATFADGEMGGGGLAGPGESTQGSKAVVIQAIEDREKTEEKGYIDTILSAIYDYFDRMT
jgi:hypothetical protein